MNNLSDISLGLDATIEDVVNCLNKFGKRIVLIVDSNDILKGIITDADLRRFVLSLQPLTTRAKEVMVTQPKVALLSDSFSQISEKLNQFSIYQIPIVNESRQVIGLKTIKDFFETKEYFKNQVILMAGGLGKRLHPVTEFIPKPLVPINGTPIIKIILDNLLDQGFNKISISINHQGNLIEKFVNSCSDLPPIQYVREDKKMGTAGSLSLLNPKPQDDFFVLNSDILTTTDYKAMLDFHKKNNFDLTLAIRREKYQLPYGVVQVEGKELKSIEEKPTHYYHANIGIYILSPKLLEHIPADTYFDMTTLIEKCLELNVKIGSFAVHEYWSDIGTPSELELAKENVPSRLFKSNN